MLSFKCSWMASRKLVLCVSCCLTSTVISSTVTLAGVQVRKTTADGKSQFQQDRDLRFSSDDVVVEADVNIELDPSIQFQVIKGFGAALTDSSAYVISQASSSVQDALLLSMFGLDSSKNGHALNILRITVGVSDFSASYAPGQLTYDDVPGDFALQHFSTSRDDAVLLPMLRRILEINPNMLIMASPWTAPLWLKNHSTLGDGWLRDDDQTFNTYAEYLARYLEDYNKKGVRIHYLTLQNEPGHGGCGAMPCMKMSPLQQERLASLVASRLSYSNANVSATKILAYDHNWGPNDGPSDTSTWNSWLFVLLFMPAPILGCMGAIALCVYNQHALYWSKHAFRSMRHAGGYDSAEEMTGSEDEGSPSVGFARLDKPYKHQPSLDDSDSEHSSNEDHDHGLVKGVIDRLNITAPHSFVYGIFWGVLVMCLAYWLVLLMLSLLYTSGIITDTRAIPDLSRTFTGPNWPAAVLSSGAGSDFAGIAWHCYGGNPGKVQSELQNRFPQIEQHMTECSGGDWSGAWEGSLFWNQKVLIMENLENSGQSVVHWNLVLDENKGPHCNGGACCSTCRGVATVPSAAQNYDEITFNVEFLGLVHHSTFLRPGARRIHSKVAPGDRQASGTDDDGVRAIAYRNTDGTLVAVIVNEKDHPLTLRVRSGKQLFYYNISRGVVTLSWLLSV